MTAYDKHRKRSTFWGPNTQRPTSAAVKMMSVGLLWFSVNVSADIAVIVNKDNPLGSVSKSDLKSMYLGKLLVFPGSDEAAVILDLKGEEHLREAFYKTVTRKSLRKMNSYWARYLFTGKGQPPTKVESEELLMKMVVASKKYIGFVNTKSLDESVKVIHTIDYLGQ